jgi:type II secretory pathway pseudopilin PulG
MGRTATSRRRPRPPAGFTLVEALISIAMAAIAGSVLMLGVTASIQTSSEAFERAIADGMARQLIDEIVGQRYAAVGAGGRQTTLSPSSWERAGAGRERYDDIDDYNGLRIQPPEDLYGVALGVDDGEGGERHPNFQAPAGYFDDWRQEIDVYYVDESDLTTRLPGGSTTDFRMVEVRIVKDQPDGTTRELARLNRVVAYVEPM